MPRRKTLVNLKKGAREIFIRRHVYPAYVSEGVDIFTNSFNFILSRSELSHRLRKHTKGNIHILACEKLVKESDQDSKFENKTDEIEVKVEMHDSDDEPLNKIIKLSDDVIDISCKEEIIKKEIS